MNKIVQYHLNIIQGRVMIMKNIYIFLHLQHNYRRYGAVEGGRFCYEGGTRCGKGEGLHVFRVDNPEDLQISFDLASKAKLENKKRAASQGFASKYHLLRKLFNLRRGTAHISLLHYHHIDSSV